MEIIPFINQKGGVGKTTCVINVGAVLAALSKRVLLIDMDIQGNLSTGLRMKPSEHFSIFHALSNPSQLPRCIQSTYLPNIHIIPSSLHLASYEFQDIYALKQLLQHVSYDYVLIDCPPSFGSIMVAAILASTKIIIPLQCEFFAVKGLVALLNIIKKIERNYKTKINIMGILPTMLDSRSKISKNILKELRQSLDIPIFDPGIARSSKVVESNSVGEPVVIYDMNCTASQGYLEFLRTSMLSQTASA